MWQGDISTTEGATREEPRVPTRLRLREGQYTSYEPVSCEGAALSPDAHRPQDATCQTRGSQTTHWSTVSIRHHRPQDATTHRSTVSIRHHRPQDATTHRSTVSIRHHRPQDATCQTRGSQTTHRSTVSIRHHRPQDAMTHRSTVWMLLCQTRIELLFLHVLVVDACILMCTNVLYKFVNVFQNKFCTNI